MISESTIRRVKDLAIEDVLKPYVSLSRKGKTLMGLCPFHSEKTGSFSVSPQKNLYHCFGCNRGGDAIAFVMEKEGLNFMDAIAFIAKKHNIPIEHTDEEQNKEELEEARHKESLLIVLDQVQHFFVDNLRVETNSESRGAREYAYSRWPEEFCSVAGIGYAPMDSGLFMDYCRTKGLDKDALLELGLLKRGEDGVIYPMFRQRIMIPIRNKWGRVIAYTARYIGQNPKAPKYINSITSPVYIKGETLFGIDRASRQRNADYFIVVEGAPDVLRMQSIGFENTVAALGTAWTEKQFDLLKSYTSALCFIPDSDVAEKGKLGPGFEAVMANGAMAIRKGFQVTVRELPFGHAPMENEEECSRGQDEEECSRGKDGEAHTLTDGEKEVTLVKNDADSYIHCKEDYTSLQEKHFIVWLAQKRFQLAPSLAEQRKCVSEIADLLRYVKDTLFFDQCLEQLVKIYGKPKLWRDAVMQAKAKAKWESEKSAPDRDERQREADRLSRHGLFVRENCYYSVGDDDEDPSRVSNFIMEPLFHIKDENNGTRLFRLRNTQNACCVIELRESELCSMNSFQQKVGSLGNYVWLAKIDKLNKVKEYLYAITDTAERVRKLGWDAAHNFFAFGNGILFEGKFRRVNEMGIVRIGHDADKGSGAGKDEQGGKAYYIPATSKMYKHNTEIYQFERMMVHEDRCGVKLYGFMEKLMLVFGDNAAVGFSYLLSTLFRDVIFGRTRHFPILNLFGEKGTGKTTLATCLQSFFLHGIDPPNLSVTSIPAMNDRVSQAVNTLVVLDEYKNDLDIKKIAFLKGLWGGGGQTKKNTNNEGLASQTIISTGIVLCGQDKPTQDMALFSRLIYLTFTKTSYSQEEKKNYDDLVSMCNLGMTHLAIEILSHRELFEKNFSEIYSITKKELATKLNKDSIPDRILNNWVIPLAAFRTLETVIDVPFSYSDLFNIAVKAIREQTDLAQESSELGEFWNMLQGYQTTGKCMDGAHYRIRYLRTFRPLSMKEDIVFNGAQPILYLNMPAVESLFSGRSMNVTANRSNWSTIVSYLKTHPSYLGMKQERFTILLSNGQPDYTIETVNGQQVRRAKVTRPKAWCFDYLKLKDAFNLELEIISDETGMENNDKASENEEENENPQQGDLLF